MLPQSVTCEECGKNAYVRGYGRVVYDWDAADDALTLRSVRLTIECPACGLRVQDHLPPGQPAAASPARPSRDLARRLQAISAALRS